jgi:hypothetical protein
VQGCWSSQLTGWWTQKELRAEEEERYKGLLIKKYVQNFENCTYYYSQLRNPYFSSMYFKSTKINKSRHLLFCDMQVRI